MTKIYFASKLKHAEKFIKWAIEHPEHHMVSRWPYLTGLVPDNAEHAVNFWDDDFADIERCDVLVVYAEQGDKLRGALVEVGYALALNKKVIVIGDHPDFGTWRHSKNVVHVTDMSDLIYRLPNS